MLKIAQYVYMDDPNFGAGNAIIIIAIEVKFYNQRLGVCLQIGIMLQRKIHDLRTYLSQRFLLEVISNHHIDTPILSTIVFDQSYCLLLQVI